MSLRGTLQKVGPFTKTFAALVVACVLFLWRIQDLPGQEARVPTSARVRTLRIAVVQMQSGDHDIEWNLKRATALAETAAAKDARLVLFPELMPTGSYLSFETWDAAEPSDGETVQWLKSTSSRLRIWLGTSFPEADGEGLFDTFV
jgi:Carbon-nitrogen hydrolase